MSTETEIRHYNQAGKVVSPRSADGLYVLKTVWHGRTINGVPYRRSEKWGWLRAAPASKIKFRTYAEQRAWAEKVRSQR